MFIDACGQHQHDNVITLLICWKLWTCTKTMRLSIVVIVVVVVVVAFCNEIFRSHILQIKNRSSQIERKTSKTSSVVYCQTLEENYDFETVLHRKLKPAPEEKTVICCLTFVVSLSFFWNLETHLKAFEGKIFIRRFLYGLSQRISALKSVKLFVCLFFIFWCFIMTVIVWIIDGVVKIQ